MVLRIDGGQDGLNEFERVLKLTQPSRARFVEVKTTIGLFLEEFGIRKKCVQKILLIFLWLFKMHFS